MADIFSKSKRSDIMSRIRCANTKPERQLLQLIRNILGHRWRIDQNVHSLPGRPDFVIRSLQTIIFVDGCFYHSCPVHGHQPKSNRRYWTAKLRKNRVRDRINRQKLRAEGFTIIRYWEHDLRKNKLQNTQKSLTKRLIGVKARMIQNQIGRDTAHGHVR